MSYLSFITNSSKANLYHENHEIDDNFFVKQQLLGAVHSFYYDSKLSAPVQNWLKLIYGLFWQSKIPWTLNICLDQQGRNQMNQSKTVAKILLSFYIYCVSVAKLIRSLVLVLHIVLCFLTEHFLHPPYCRWQQKQVRNNAYVGHSKEFTKNSILTES